MNSFRSRSKIWALAGGLCGLWGAAASYAGDEANNGGGAGEATISYVYERLDYFVGPCLGNRACLADPARRDLLERVLRLPRTGGLEFHSESREPGFFMLDGAVRAAKTSLTPGAVIYVNRDLLYAKNAQGAWAALDTGAAVAILVHELGHQTGEPDHDRLDRLGAEVRAFLSRSMQTAELDRKLIFSRVPVDSLFGPETVFPSFTSIDGSSRPPLASVSALFLRTGESFLDFTGSLAHSLTGALHNIGQRRMKCLLTAVDCGFGRIVESRDSYGHGRFALDGFRLDAIHWTSSRVEGRDKLVAQLESPVLLKVKDGKTGARFELRGLKLRVLIAFVRSGNEFKLNSVLLSPEPYSDRLDESP